MNRKFTKLSKDLVHDVFILYGLVWLYFGLVWYGSASFGVWPLSIYVTMQNLELVALKMSELCQFLFNLVWFGLVWFFIIWCLTIGQICYHAKSGSCSFTKFQFMPILVYFGLLWFGLVIFWFGLIWFWIIWCMTIVQICYHAKSGACSFKNDQVMPILIKFGLVWY